MKKSLILILSLLLILTACGNKDQQKIDAVNEQLKALYQDDQKTALKEDLNAQQIEAIRQALKDISDTNFTAATEKELTSVEQVMTIRESITKELPEGRMYYETDLARIDAFISELKAASPTLSTKLITPLQERREQIVQFLGYTKKAEQVLSSYASVMKDGYKVIDELTKALPTIQSAEAKAELEKVIENLSFFAGAFSEVQATTSLDYDYNHLSVDNFAGILGEIKNRNEKLFQEMNQFFQTTLNLAEVYYDGKVVEGTSPARLLEIESMVAMIPDAELRAALKAKVDEATRLLTEEQKPPAEPKPQGNFYSEQNDEYVLKSMLEMAKAAYQGSQPLKLQVLDSTKEKLTVQVYEDFSDHKTAFVNYEYDRAKNTVTDLLTGQSVVLPSN